MKIHPAITTIIQGNPELEIGESGALIAVAVAILFKNHPNITTFSTEDSVSDEERERHHEKIYDLCQIARRGAKFSIPDIHWYENGIQESPEFLYMSDELPNQRVILLTNDYNFEVAILFIGTK